MRELLQGKKKENGPDNARDILPGFSFEFIIKDMKVQIKHILLP